MLINKKGFIFIETIIVVCILTVALMSLYGNYSKIMANTKELNTFDVSEYNYKTYFLKSKFLNNSSLTTTNPCITETSINFSDNNKVKICKLSNITNNGTRSIKQYLSANYSKFDAYIIDYLNKIDLNQYNDNLFIVEYKKTDKQNTSEYLTYVSSLNY